MGSPFFGSESVRKWPSLVWKLVVKTQYDSTLQAREIKLSQMEIRYGISAVQYDSDGKRIVSVEAHRLSQDDKLSARGIYPRAAVIQAIEEKRLTLVTLPTAYDGKYTVGSPIVVVEIQNEKFLKMADALGELAADELDALPKF